MNDIAPHSNRTCTELKHSPYYMSWKALLAATLEAVEPILPISRAFFLWLLVLNIIALFRKQLMLQMCPPKPNLGTCALGLLTHSITGAPKVPFLLSHTGKPVKNFLPYFQIPASTDPFRGMEVFKAKLKCQLSVGVRNLAKLNRICRLIEINKYVPLKEKVYIYFGGHISVFFIDFNT